MSEQPVISGADLDRWLAKVPDAALRPLVLLAAGLRWRSWPDHS